MYNKNAVMETAKCGGNIVLNTELWLSPKSVH